MDNPQLYDRQRLLNLEVPNSVTIAGCGGIGSWAAIDLAMSGVPNLYLFDPDIMEESNRNRLPFCQSSLNHPKVDIVAEYILAIRPDCIVVPVQNKLEDIFLQIQLGVSQWIMDCTDSPRSQFAIYKACTAVGVHYIRAGYDGTGMTVTSHVSGWVKSAQVTGEEAANYTVAPSWVVPAQVVAALAVYKMMKKNDQEVACDVGDIGIEVLLRQERPTARCHQAGRDTTETGRGETARIRTGRMAR